MRNQLFEKFYRNELEKILSTFVEKWSKKVMATPNEVRIRKMKTRWGTCNSDDKRIWLNLELAKKPKICISYVVLHEVIHLIEKKHSEKFIGILDSLMPNWNAIRDELNMYPLSHTNWNCSVK